MIDLHHLLYSESGKFFFERTGTDCAYFIDKEEIYKPESGKWEVLRNKGGASYFG
jgi:hypothetical protein